MRFTHLLLVTLTLPLCLCGHTFGSFVSDATITITIDDAGNGSVRQILGSTTFALGMNNVTATYNGAPVMPTGSNFVIDILADNDVIVFNLQAESDCDFEESALGFDISSVFVPPMGGEIADPFDLTISAQVSATDNSVAGETGTASASVQGIEADLSVGTTSDSGPLSLAVGDISVGLSAESVCSAAVPEPSPFLLLGLLAVGGFIRRSFRSQ